MGNLEALPAAIRRHLGGCPLEDRTFSQTAGTFYCPHGGGLYLRVNPSGKERDNALMTQYFYEKGLGPQVVEYVGDGEHDYLLTRALPGENALSPRLLENPKRLAEELGKAFRRLHEIRGEDIPVKGFSAWFAGETRDFLENEVFKEKSSEEFRNHYGYTPQEALDALPRMERYEDDFSLIHGDACLPNVMFADFTFTGFIDLGLARLGDRHYDLAATLWSLGYNLKSPDYAGVFLDAYGRDFVDKDRLALCRLSWY